MASEWVKCAFYPHRLPCRAHVAVYSRNRRSCIAALPGRMSGVVRPYLPGGLGGVVMPLQRRMSGSSPR